MIYNIVIPALGATGSDVVLEEWRAKPGQFIKSGSALFVVTTDKATVEVEAFHDGYLRETLFYPGEIVPVQTVVGRMADTLEESLAAASVLEQSKSEEPVAQKVIIPQIDIKPPRRRLASPLARRMAEELGIDLSSVKASGSGGQILKRDIVRTAEQMQVKGGIRRIALSPMRRAIAERTQKSNTDVPHFHGSVKVDMTDAKALLKFTTARATERNQVPPTITDLCLRAAALALRKTPALNASFRGEEIWFFDEINIGVVVGLAEGMMIPVVHHADELDLFSMAAITHRLRKSAEEGLLSNMDLIGATFTVSNLGMFGLDEFSALINPPEAGILALGVVREQPAAWRGELVLRWIMTATLAVDHRAIDGVTLAKFLNEIRQYLENPIGLAL